MRIKKYWNSIVLILLALSIIGNVISVTGYQKKKKQIDDPQSYPLLSPRIFAERQNDILINFWALRAKLRQEVVPYGDTFSFYFEYLPSGITIGINEKTEVVAASLIKLPVAIAYFYQLEKDGLVWPASEVTIEKKHLDSGFGTLWQTGEGTKISLDKAMELSLVESDNTAANVLKSHVFQKNFNEVYEGLDIDIHEQEGKVLIGAKSYSSTFKALYFSSLISKQSSQRILQLLTQTAFNDKLVAPLPPTIKVAHKIGVFASENIYQDCGIVYVPQRPYILCMFSRSDEEVARMRMNTVSSMVYKFVSRANENR